METRMDGAKLIPIKERMRGPIEIPMVFFWRSPRNVVKILWNNHLQKANKEV